MKSTYVDDDIHVSIGTEMNASEKRKKVLEQAWIGDAVLSLYARRRILRESEGVDSARLELMTSNRFLAGLGEPSEVEADIGRVFEREGLAAAFEWIEQNLIPLFVRQEEKRLRATGVRQTKKKSRLL